MNRPFPRILLHFFYAVAVVAVGLTLYACANMARPGGGPYDEEPPVYVRSKPALNQTNVAIKGGTTRVEIVFDENVKLDKAFEKVVVSPPQKTLPVVKSNGHTVTVELADTLLPNTTYTIDFGDAIQDNNEGNPLENFTFAFSTGERIDSLEVAGTVINAADLEPVSGMYVGLQSDLSDSAFYTTPFVRLSKTNDQGQFFIRNVAPGSYRVYGLKDVNSNYIFDIPSEDIAFVDSIVIPTADIKLHRDTLWRDSLTIDTIMVHDVAHFYPYDLVLRAFNEDKKSVYLEKSERLQPNKLTLYFSAPEDSLPVIRGLNFDDSDWALIEKSLHNDTVNYWLKDSALIKMDTLRLEATYLYTDTLKQLVPRTDTLELFMKKAKQAAAPKKESKKHKGEEQDSIKIEFLSMKDRTASQLEIGSRPRFEFDEPILPFEQSAIRLELMRDSLLVLQASELVPVGESLREYELRGNYKPGEQYVITIDSAAFTGLYGLHTNTFTKNLSVKKVDEYSNLLIAVSGVRDSAFIELLDTRDSPVMRAPVKNGEAKFMHVKPGTYYARLIKDSNGNGLFDTGDYAERRQPEEVYYYSEPLNLRANWDVKQEWDIYARPLIKQKPLDITKNKPKEEKKKSRNAEQYPNSKRTGTSSASSSSNAIKSSSTQLQRTSVN